MSLPVFNEDKPLVLVISHVVPWPPAAGNEIRILKMLQEIKANGFGIVMLLNTDYIEEGVREKLHELLGPVHLLNEEFPAEPPGAGAFPGENGCPVCRITGNKSFQWLHSPFDCERKSRAAETKRWLASERMIRAAWNLWLKYKPVAVLAEYIFTSPCLAVIPEGTLRIVDTHDMFSRKKRQVLRYGIDDPLSISKREERLYLSPADLVIAIQSHEAMLLRALDPYADVITVGIDFETVPAGSHGETVPGRILVVGSDNPLNRHGLKEFHAHAWPLIRQEVPQATLCVVGKLAKCLETDDDRVQLNGWVEDLALEYRQAAVVVNPTVAGTGLKIKSVEALCHGKALVSTRNGVEGIGAEGADAPFLVAATWPEVAESVVSLLKSDVLRRQMENRALSHAALHFGTEAVYRPLIRRLKALRTDPH